MFAGCSTMTIWRIFRGQTANIQENLIKPIDTRSSNDKSLLGVRRRSMLGTMFTDYCWMLFRQTQEIVK